MIVRGFFSAFLSVLAFGPLVAQNTNELKAPLEAVLQTTAWSSVLLRDHDLTVTVHFGSKEDNEGRPAPSQSVEGIVKSRQIYDSKIGAHWIPYAKGDFTLRFDTSNVEPDDQRALGVFIGDNDEAKEISFNGRAAKTIRGAVDPLRASNPINITFVTNNPYARGPSSSNRQISDFDTVLARLDSLDSSQLRVTEEKFDGRKVIVYRVKAIPTPKSKSIATNKIVVSAEGFDRGLILQYVKDSMKLDDKHPYENDRQLMGDSPKSQRIYWKEFQVEGGQNKLVLPVSVSTKHKGGPNVDGYMNVSLEWNSFSSPKKELRSIEACEKIAQEFDKQINKALNR